MMSSINQLDFTFLIKLIAGDVECIDIPLNHIFRRTAYESNVIESIAILPVDDIILTINHFPDSCLNLIILAVIHPLSDLTFSDYQKLEKHIAVITDIDYSFELLLEIIVLNKYTIDEYTTDEYTTGKYTHIRDIMEWLVCKKDCIARTWGTFELLVRHQEYVLLDKYLRELMDKRSDLLSLQLCEGIIGRLFSAKILDQTLNMIAYYSQLDEADMSIITNIFLNYGFPGTWSTVKKFYPTLDNDTKFFGKGMICNLSLDEIKIICHEVYCADKKQTYIY